MVFFSEQRNVNHAERLFEYFLSAYDNQSFESDFY